jgi:creatinine amidohydrolase/Fe(II)-dependent formamide hydrolase-like protein
MKNSTKKAGEKKNGYLLGELTWPESKKRFASVDIALLPTGSIEQHGPHLPLDTDSFDADYLARQVADRCSNPKPIVLPLIPYGVSYHHEEFSGTISVTNETLSKFVYEIGMSVARNGVKKLLIINGHGGNSPALTFAAQMINRDAHIFVGVDSGETSDIDIEGMVDTANDVHAGEIETSTTLAIRPHLVNMKKAQKSVPGFSSRYLNFTSKRGISWYAYTHRISSNGVMGDPSKASAEKGAKIWEVMIEHLVNLAEDLKNMTLEEIYQRRY